jgi:hypothetical protein
LASEVLLRSPVWAALLLSQAPVFVLRRLTRADFPVHLDSVLLLRCGVFSGVSRAMFVVCKVTLHAMATAALIDPDMATMPDMARAVIFATATVATALATATATAAMAIPALRATAATTPTASGAAGVFSFAMKTE